MCGIIGYVGQREVSPLLIAGLKRLEYRGYDSAGVALQQPDGSLALARACGKVAALEEVLTRAPLHGHCGIAHTRWATHGQPSERNAHPHAAPGIAIVHNGIIENYQELRAELQTDGAVFASDTDSEVIAWWLWRERARGTPFEAAFRALPSVLHGAYAIVAITEDAPQTLYTLRHGSPLVIGIGTQTGERWIASDTLALTGCAEEGFFLKDGQGAIIRPDAVTCFDARGDIPTPETAMFGVQTQEHDKGDYPHFMLKEIYEQPEVIRRTLTHYFDAHSGLFRFDGLKLPLESINALTIVACGTSFYTAQVVSYWLEQTARIPVRIDIASEFRYRQPVLSEGSVALFISQSGETADTLAAMRYVKEAGHPTIALVNVATSTMAREADHVIRTLAGAEIGVASTKAFTAQLTTLACLTLAIARARGTLSQDDYGMLAHGLSDVSDKLERVLARAEDYDTLALALMYARDMLFIGRGTSYPLACEGALKMKEISYIHAEGYAAGELKHGPIALVDDGVPIIVIAPDDALFDKSASNLEETAARKGNIVLISSQEKIAAFKGNMTHSAALPACHPFHAPILYALPLQLLAYYVGLHKGVDIDQPRNLAKSVTVE